MKIIVFSDTHGVNYPMKEVMRLHQNADLFLHLGDGAPDFVTLCQSQGLPFAAVRESAGEPEGNRYECTLWIKGWNEAFKK